MAILPRCARAALLLVVAWGWGVLPVAAETLPVLTVDIGEAQVLRLPEPAETVFVADPELADVQVSGAQTVILFGVKTGRTTFYAIDGRGRTILARDVRVRHNMSVLESVLAERFPGERVFLTSAPNTIMIEGAVSTSQEAQAILATVRGVVGKDEQIIDRLRIETATQVSIRVRVAEVARRVDQRLGINWQSIFEAGDFAFGLFTGRDFLVSSTTGVGALGGAIVLPTNEAGSYLGSARTSNVSVDALIDALAQEGLARTLAEPNLTAVSGQKASFIAGGEFPIPVSQDNDSISIEFKQFGVMLDFVPTVLSPDRISLNVRPEVSELTEQGAIRLNGISIPALNVRRVETTVELGSGQSLVIGGLLQNSTSDLVRKIPGLGDIPVLGSLFTSTSYQKNETELVVIVTPFVVKPTAPEELDTPFGRYGPAGPFEQLLLGRLGEQAPRAGAPRRLHGPVGFVF